jgi:hypothetical protein
VTRPFALQPTYRAAAALCLRLLTGSAIGLPACPGAAQVGECLFNRDNLRP